MQRRTRIVATLGPATDSPSVLGAMLAAGLDVARVNFAHGDAADHRRRIAQLRTATAALGRPVAVLADLPGPKLRVLLAGERTLTAGEEIVFGTGPSPEVAALAVTEPDCLAEVLPGHRLLLDDGRFQLRAVRAEPGRLVARVEVGGRLLPRKGVNLPDTRLSLPALTAADRAALAVALAAGVDWLALSFVREPAAADELRAACRDLGHHLPILAKVERPEAVAHADDVVEAFDGVMVARGDLGVELPLERVPAVQKRLIARARAAGKPVVTATDMLDSMRHNPRPTRAEASDVANAIYDGTDAVMLSGETSVGSYPVEAVACMDRIARATEADRERSGPRELALLLPTLDDLVTQSACTLARQTEADAIVTPTVSGHTARLVARHRPRARVVAPTPSEAVMRQMALVWGLTPVRLGPEHAGEDRLAAAVRVAHAAGAVRAGERVVVLAGHPVEGGERLPTLRLVRVGTTGESSEP